jgi:hypothetical protein
MDYRLTKSMRLKTTMLNELSRDSIFTALASLPLYGSWY